jgi:PPOX class probable F420-dependent enzyme
MAVALDETTRRLLDGKAFAVISTIGPDGAPQTSVVWVKRDDDAVLFTTTTRRQKARNLARDPRVSLSIFDAANLYQTFEIRGRAELVPDPNRNLSRELTRKYLGTDPPADPPGEERLIVRVVPDKVIVFSA